MFKCKHHDIDSVSNALVRIMIFLHWKL